MNTSISAATTKANTRNPVELLLLLTASILCRQALNNMSKRFMNHKIRMQRPDCLARYRTPTASLPYGYSRGMTSQIPCEPLSYSRKNKVANFGYIPTIRCASRPMVEFWR